MEYRRKKCFWQKLFITVALLFVPCFIVLKSTNVNATSVSTSSADVSFWSTSASGQINATVSLPWDTNIGGSASDLQQFYLNSIVMTYPISASSSDTSIYGRLVMRFTPWFNSNEDAFFCDKRLNDYTSSVEGVSTLCSGTITYNYSDGSSYSVSAPLYFNFILPNGNLNAYVDYTQALPNTALSSITLTLSKSGSYDVYSVPSGYGLVLSTLSGNASYYLGGSGVDFGPIINQNQTIINQNQEYYDHEYQAEDNISNQSSSDIPNSENSQTTSIIGTISSFVSAIGTVQTGSCQMTLPFPSFLGGDTTVNPCTGKDKAPTIVTIGSSMFLIGIFIPFAFVVLKMIYNEIRSFTNG